MKGSSKKIIQLHDHKRGDIIGIPLHDCAGHHDLAIGEVGEFSYNFETDVTLGNGLDRMIWGLAPHEEYNFDRAVEAVHKEDKQKFIDFSFGSVGKVKSVEFDLRLANGHHTRERYQFLAHSDDMEITNHPVFCIGTTTLKEKALKKFA